MKIAFIASGQEILGIEYLSAILKEKGHEVKLFFDPKTFSGGIFLKIKFLEKRFNLQDKIVDKVIEWKPDIVGFSCMSTNYPWCLETAKLLKSKIDIPIIFGGIHPTILFEKVIKQNCVDYVAIGESELSFVEFLDNFKNGKLEKNVDGIYSGNNVPKYTIVEDLDKLPFPDHNLFYEKVDGFRRVAYSIAASRGCPYACSYCCNDILKKFNNFKRRVRSVDNVIEELKLAKDKFNISRVYFYDEVFPYQIEWLKDFCQRYGEEIKLPFIITSHFNFATEERLKMLGDAGCIQMVFGLQSASGRVREDICNRFFNSNSQVEEVIKLCKKYKIQSLVEIILGLPSETEEEYEEGIKFFREIKADIIYTYFLTYFPKTSIIQKGIEYGNLSESDIETIESGSNSFLHEGSFTKNKKKLLEYQILIDLSVLLPKVVHRVISKKCFRKLLPKRYFIHSLLIFIADITSKHSVFWNKIQPALSRKHVP